MKKDQVPQDDANLLEGRTRDVCYAVDEKGNYVQVLSTGWEPKSVALLQAWKEINAQVDEAVHLVKTEKASPLAFFMAKCMFDVKLLSDYTDIPKRKIKSHLDPEQFNHLDEATLMKYAEAFNITPDELVNWQKQTDSPPGSGGKS
ncbi:MAG: hypothetical protein JW943_15920 [Deltaproteobacteria bacterium]|nr:hypothetical protein [Deltaproteobacteria bacterium]